MSDWHDELELALLPLEDLRVDSVYMTFVISNALSERGIFHQCRIGYAEDRTEPNDHRSPLLGRARTGLVYRPSAQTVAG